MSLLLFCGPVPSPEAMDHNTYLCTPDLITYQIYLCVQIYIWFCTTPPPPPKKNNDRNELIQELPSLRCELSWHFNIYGHLLLPKLLNMHCTSSSPQRTQIKWKSLTYLESTVYTFQMYLQTLACPHFWDLSKLTQFCIKHI